MESSESVLIPSSTVAAKDGDSSAGKKKIKSVASVASMDSAPTSTVDTTDMLEKPKHASQSTNGVAVDDKNGDEKREKGEKDVEKKGKKMESSVTATPSGGHRMHQHHRNIKSTTDPLRMKSMHTISGYPYHATYAHFFRSLLDRQPKEALFWGAQLCTVYNAKQVFESLLLFTQEYCSLTVPGLCKQVFDIHSKYFHPEMDTVELHSKFLASYIKYVANAPKSSLLPEAWSVISGLVSVISPVVLPRLPSLTPEFKTIVDNQKSMKKHIPTMTCGDSQLSLWQWWYDRCQLFIEKKVKTAITTATTSKSKSTASTPDEPVQDWSPIISWFNQDNKSSSSPSSAPTVKDITATLNDEMRWLINGMLIYRIAQEMNERLGDDSLVSVMWLIMYHTPRRVMQSLPDDEKEKCTSLLEDLMKRIKDSLSMYNDSIKHGGGDPKLAFFQSLFLIARYPHDTPYLSEDRRKEEYSTPKDFLLMDPHVKASQWELIHALAAGEQKPTNDVIQKSRLLSFHPLFFHRFTEFANHQPDQDMMYLLNLWSSKDMEEKLNINLQIQKWPAKERDKSHPTKGGIRDTAQNDIIHIIRTTDYVVNADEPTMAKEFVVPNPYHDILVALYTTAVGKKMNADGDEDDTSDIPVHVSAVSSSSNNTGSYRQQWLATYADKRWMSRTWPEQFHKAWPEFFRLYDQVKRQKDIEREKAEKIKSKRAEADANKRGGGKKKKKNKSSDDDEDDNDGGDNDDNQKGGNKKSKSTTKTSSPGSELPSVAEYSIRMGKSIFDLRPGLTWMKRDDIPADYLATTKAGGNDAGGGGGGGGRGVKTNDGGKAGKKKSNAATSSSSAVVPQDSIPDYDTPEEMVEALRTQAKQPKMKYVSMSNEMFQTLMDPDQTVVWAPGSMYIVDDSNSNTLYWVIGPLDWNKKSERKQCIFHCLYPFILREQFKVATHPIHSVYTEPGKPERLYLIFEHLGDPERCRKSIQKCLKSSKPKFWNGSRHRTIDLDETITHTSQLLEDCTIKNIVNDKKRFPDSLFSATLLSFLTKVTFHRSGGPPSLDDIWFTMHQKKAYALFTDFDQSQTVFVNWSDFVKQVKDKCAEKEEDLPTGMVPACPKSLWIYFQSICERVANSPKNGIEFDDLKFWMEPLWNAIFVDKKKKPKMPTLKKLTSKLQSFELAAALLSKLSVILQSFEDDANGGGSDGGGGGGGPNDGDVGKRSSKSFKKEAEDKPNTTTTTKNTINKKKKSEDDNGDEVNRNDTTTVTVSKKKNAVAAVAVPSSSSSKEKVNDKEDKARKGGKKRKSAEPSSSSSSSSDSDNDDDDKDDDNDKGGKGGKKGKSSSPRKKRKSGSAAAGKKKNK